MVLTDNHCANTLWSASSDILVKSVVSSKESWNPSEEHVKIVQENSVDTLVILSQHFYFATYTWYEDAILNISGFGPKTWEGGITEAGQCWLAPSKETGLISTKPS